MERRRLLLIFTLLSSAFTLSQFYRVSPAVISSTLIEELKIEAEDLGILGGAFFYSFALCQVPMGLFLDRVGPRKVMSFLIALGGLGSFVFAASSKFEFLLLGRILLGIGMSASLMGSLKVFVLSFPSDRFATYSGLLLSFGTIGNILASSPLAYMNVFIGWRLTFVIFGILTCFISFLLFHTLKDAEKQKREISESKPKPLEAVTSIIKNLSFWQVAALAFSRYGTFVAIQGLWFGPYLINVKGFNPVLAGNIIMMLSFGTIIGSAFAGYISDRILKSPKKTVLIGVSFYALSLLFFVGVVKIESAFAFFVIFWLVGFFNSFGILLYPHIKGLFPSEISGTVMSSVNFFTMAGGAFFMQVMGSIIELFGKENKGYPPYAYEYAFFFLFLSVVFGLIFYAFSKEKKDESD
ncbi:MAG: MFS transporter [Desulfobacterota bacterium]|nr:MFS transporter [Thermodesulfobacteriota bacterium]MDW8002147.1 MFS transporter [Deltaproteobacteria bacterium]